MVMLIWCRIWFGHDSWSDGWASILSYGAITFFLILIFGWFVEESRGDVLVSVSTVDQWCYAGSPVAVELPRNLGFVSFTQSETQELSGGSSGFGDSGMAWMAVGPAWSVAGNPLGSIAIQTVVDQVYDGPGGDGVIWDGYGRTIGQSEHFTDWGVLWGGVRNLPNWVTGDGDDDWNENPVFVPFQWEFYDSSTLGIGSSGPISGSGWVSLARIKQSTPGVAPDGGADWFQGSRFLVMQVVIAQEDLQLRSGEIPSGFSSVPEPGTWAALGAAFAVAVVWRAWRVRR